jgi:AraC family transcriptional regulator
MDFGVRLGGTLLTLHLYLRRALIEEVTQSIQPGDPTQVELLPRIGDSDPVRSKNKTRRGTSQLSCVG